MQFVGVKRYPEWKELFDGIIPLIDSGKSKFTFDELTALAGGLDVRLHRGRAQFYRMRRELLNTRQLWMEFEWSKFVSDRGYSIIPAKDHPAAAGRRMNYARRRVRMAASINTNVRIEELTPEQRIFQAATAAVLHELSKTFHAMGKHLAAVRKDPAKLPVDLEGLINSINRPKRIKGPGKQD